MFGWNAWKSRELRRGAGTRAGFRNREGGREGNGEEGLPAAAGAAREQEIEKRRGRRGKGRRGQE